MNEQDRHHSLVSQTTIFQAIEEAGEITSDQLRDEFGMTRSAVAYHLKNLRRQMKIETDGAANDPLKLWRVAAPETGPDGPMDACLWNDGTLIVRRGETVVLSLVPAETRELRNFLIRSALPDPVEAGA